MQDIVMYSTNLMKVLVSFRGDWIGGEVLGRYLGINLFFFFSVYLYPSICSFLFLCCHHFFFLDIPLALCLSIKVISLILCLSFIPQFLHFR